MKPWPRPNLALMVNVYICTLMLSLRLTQTTPASPASPIPLMSTRSDMVNNEHGDAMSPTFRTTSIGDSGEYHNPSLGHGIPNSGGYSVDNSANAEDGNDMTPHPSTVYTQSPIHFVLTNFFIAMFLISLVIFVIFFAVTWLILRDARMVDLRMFSNSTGPGVSLCLCP